MFVGTSHYRICGSPIVDVHAYTRAMRQAAARCKIALSNPSLTVARSSNQKYALLQDAVDQPTTLSADSTRPHQGSKLSTRFEAHLLEAVEPVQRFLVFAHDG